MKIQPIHKEQLGIVADLAYAIWPVAYADMISHEQLNYMLEKIYALDALSHQMKAMDHQFIVVFDENQKPIAFASYGLTSDESTEFIKLHKLYILPDLQGKGIGKSVVSYIVSEMMKQGQNLLRLNVNRNNIALNFYHKLGFEIIKEEDIDIGNGFFMNDFVMEKRI
jgi:ribosomal protein S18 acetylase RimI-like enzyme